jgi:TetR/AcrR family transcriptional regulator
MNWVPKWFKPSGAWTPAQLTVALSQIFERALSSSPAAALPRDVGDLPAAGSHEPVKQIPPGKRVLTFSSPSRAGQTKKVKAGGKS